MNAYEIVKLACKGNKDAENFCNAWVDFCHALDDCVDRDKPVTPDAVAKAFTGYTVELAGNPFFQVNKGLLVGLMVQSANYWVESHNRKDAGERDVTKCFWHAVIYEVAHLIGGWVWVREVTAKTLEFDHEPPKCRYCGGGDLSRLGGPELTQDDLGYCHSGCVGRRVSTNNGSAIAGTADRQDCFRCGYGTENGRGTLCNKCREEAGISVESKAT